MLSIVDAGVVIDQPGVYDAVPEAEYHGHRGSLSHSRARLLLPPNCPAKFRYQQDHPQPPKKEFEHGHAAHQRVLGAGPQLVLVDRDRWDTKECKAEVAAIRGRGDVPLKRADYDRVQAMADAIRAHPLASELLDPECAAVEQSVFWVDAEYGVWRRARIDAWRNDRLADYKTTASAAPEHVAKSIYNFGYHMQAAWYLDAAAAVGAEADMFLLVFQETVPPYLVNVVQPDDTAIHIGRQANRRALETFRDCTTSGVWPGYSDGIELIGLPGWAERDALNDIERWDQDL